MLDPTLLHVRFLIRGVCLAISLSSALAAEPCRILVVDDQNGWPVPLVKLETTHHATFITDNAGVVAFDLPELMGQETWLSLTADGYEIKADGFGFRGFRFTPTSGETHEVKVTRTSIAQRLGRLTGAGQFAESQKLGQHLDWQESGVLGCDSVQNVIHDGKLFWAWGDTNLAKYPLGIFHMTSATTAPLPLSDWKAPLTLTFDYFRDDAGAVRAVANVAPDDPGPTWLGGYASLPDAEGKAHLVACYSKIKAPLDAYRIGLCEWDPATESFQSVKVLWDEQTGGSRPKLLPDGHPVRWTDPENREWLLFGDPFPALKMPATWEAWQDPTQWEELDSPKTLTNLDGKKIKVHRGAIIWNEHRQGWVTIFGENGGKPSVLGEIWYAEAKSPLGPWGPAVKVLSHQAHTFYNPQLHPELVPAGSSVLLFEGTYTTTFSKTKEATARYDYNQILYRVDLDDPLLAPAWQE